MSAPATGQLERLRAYDPFAGAAGAGLLRYVVLDVFTARPLEGNQLAVFPDGEGLDSERMQSLARELKLSESVFLLAPEAGGDVRARIFTPSAELPFAGHPVLGTAVFVGAALERAQVTLETGAGPIAVRVRQESALLGSGWMSQPLPSWQPYEREAELLAALGLERSGLPVEVYENGPRHVFVEHASAQAVADLRPNLGALEDLGQLCINCFAAAPGGGWKTRMFAPGLGVPEDPATGSAAGPLALHLARHGRIAFGEEIEISQGSEIARPSLLRARVEGGPERVESVEVGGGAVILATGAFAL
jgi:trans-2,3-dihydro-3-hydroxyanthranilate isomerase